MSLPRCTHRIDDSTDGLPCTRTDDHTPGHGCTYTSSTGSELNDRHGEQGHG